MNPDLFSQLMQPSRYFGATESVVLVYGLGLAAPLLLSLMALFAALLWRFRATREERAFIRGPILAAGPAALRGTVERARDTDRVIHTELEQVCDMRGNRVTWERWTEVARRVEASPFYLRLDSGHRIRVEPSNDLHFADELDRNRTRFSPHSRIRVADLASGMEACVRGELVKGQDPGAEKGYREDFSLVLRAPLGGRMLVSTAPAARFHRRARARLIAGLVTILSTLLLQLLHLQYHARVFWGRDVQCRILSNPFHHVPSVPGRYVFGNEPIVTTCGTDGRSRPFEDSIPRRLWDRMQRGDIVPVRFVQNWPRASQIGWGATATELVVMPIGIGLLLPLILYVVLARSAVPWHERRRLVEREKYSFW